MPQHILITGATGGLGGEVIDLLRADGNEYTLSALTRHPDGEAAGALADKGVTVKAGDYADPDSLVGAFAGVDVLYFVSGEDGPDRAALHANVIDAAKAAGVRHVVYTSAVRKSGSEDGALATLLGSHQATEAKLQASGLTYTILRHALYAEVIGLMIGDREQLLATQTIYLPAGTGRVAYVPRTDLAAAGARVLADPAAYADTTLELTGNEDIGYAEVAATLSEALGTPITYVSPDVATFEARMRTAGLPEPVIDLLRNFSVATAEGVFDKRSSDLEALLGRPPQSTLDFIRRQYR